MVRKKKQIKCITLCCIIAFTALWGCGRKELDISRTYLIYMNGSDLETDYGAGSADIAEMLTPGIATSSKILIQTGGTEKWHNDDIKSGASQRFIIKDKSLVLLQDTGNENMGSAKTLKDFISWGVTSYPADEYYLILWNHGGGAISGFGSDEEHNLDTLRLKEIRDAIESACKKEGIIFSFIAFDACLMATYENMVLLSPYCDYFVGSQELMSAEGFDYKSFFSKEKQTPAENGMLASLLAKGYYNSMSGKAQMDYFTISVLDMRKFASCIPIFNDCAAELNQKLAEQSKIGAFERYGSELIRFGARNPYEGYSNMVDVGSLFVNTELTLAPAFHKALEESIVYRRNGITSQNACGVSVYFPLNRTFDIARELNVYYSLDFSRQYCEMLKSLPYDFSAVKEPSAISELVKNKSYEAYSAGEGKMYSYFTVFYYPGEPKRIRKSKLSGEVHIIGTFPNAKKRVGTSAAELKYIPAQ